LCYWRFTSRRLSTGINRLFTRYDFGAVFLQFRDAEVLQGLKNINIGFGTKKKYALEPKNYHNINKLFSVEVAGVIIFTIKLAYIGVFMHFKWCEIICCAWVALKNLNIHQRFIYLRHRFVTRLAPHTY
jgi:hypothetical protein